MRSAWSVDTDSPCHRASDSARVRSTRPANRTASLPGSRRTGGSSIPATRSTTSATFAGSLAARAISVVRSAFTAPTVCS
ncbi:hypothetical protein [Saccharothrix sp. HUAS TT1]|uniref:hypothetical protein n=1 Tax=unclassified Saccharothrix TaxID=2593673 RepID=UPI00345C4EAB